MFTLYTCSFDEYLPLKGKAELLQEVGRLSRQKEAKSAMLSALEVEWNNFMIYGGYPAVILETDMEEKSCG